jgi:uncharacterized membrane protein YcaP (DUF421 family)
MFINIVWKTALLYLIVVLSMRLMGKRQIGQLQPFEFAIAVMISEMLADNPDSYTGQYLKSLKDLNT